MRVNYATVDGTASAPGDYTAKSGTLTFSAGQTTKSVLVSSIQDALDEPNQTFRLQLSSPVAATIADPSGWDDPGRRPLGRWTPVGVAVDARFLGRGQALGSEEPRRVHHEQRLRLLAGLPAVDDLVATG